MLIDQVAVIMFSCCSLCLLWVLAAFLWRDYRIDKFRQEIFTVRDQMFDYAAASHVAFTNPAYIAVRSSMNGLIRFAHKITFSRAVMSVLVPQAALNMADVYAPLHALPEGDIKEHLTEYHTRATEAVVRFLVSGSPLLAVGFCCYIAFKWLQGTAGRLRGFAGKVPGLVNLEAQALRTIRQQPARLPLSSLKGRFAEN